MKLSDKALQAATNLRVSEDWNLILKELHDQYIAHAELCVGATVHDVQRLQGAAKVLRDLFDDLLAAPDILEKRKRR